MSIGTRCGERRRWRLAVAGCGGAAFCLHLPLLSVHPAFRVVAVTDREPARAREAARRFTVPRVTSDVAEVLTEIDMLLVLTGVHESLIEMALEAGVHVFTEKPLSLDFGRTSALRQRALKANLLLEVGAMRAYDPVLYVLLETIAARKIDSGVLIKADGTDQATRMALLPAGFAPYTFGADPPPVLPTGLDACQVRVLQMLLWQGYHQFTVLAVICPELTALACFTTPEITTVHAIVQGGDAVFTVIITPAPAGLYRDEAHLDGDNQSATITFSSPYLAGGTTDLRYRQAGNAEDHTAGPLDGPFASMWNAIEARLRRVSGLPALGFPIDREHLDSAELARRIEKLAADLAALVSVPNETTHLLEGRPLT